MDKESPGNAGKTGDMGWIPGLKRSPGAGHGNPLHYSCPENSMEREAWQAVVQMVAKATSTHIHVGEKGYDVK